MRQGACGIPGRLHGDEFPWGGGGGASQEKSSVKETGRRAVRQ